MVIMGRHPTMQYTLITLESKIFQNKLNFPNKYEMNDKMLLKYFQ